MKCRCGEVIHKRRVALGYALCIQCGEREARRSRHCIVPMNKSNYVVVTDRSLLKQLNPKRVA